LFLLDRKNKKQLMMLWGLALILAGLHFLHVRILTGSFLGGGLEAAFFERTSLENSAVQFSVLQYISQIRLWSSTLFTNTLLASAVIGLIVLLRQKEKLLLKLILSVFIYCIYPIFFANASFIHSYFIFYLIFPLSLLGGYFCLKLIEFRKIFLILASGIVLAIWFERNAYVKALNESTGDKLAVEVAEKIKSGTAPTEKTLVEPYEYVYSRLPILSYYSNRNVIVTGSSNWIVKISGENYAITKNKIK
jgi:hypothetical protein